MLGDIKVAFKPVKRYKCFSQAKRQRYAEEFDNFWKDTLLKMPRLDDVDVKPIQVTEDVYFKADKPWTQLSQIQKNHQHECETCAYPYYNDLPEEEALLTIHSHLLEKDMKVSPYQHLFVTAENFQLGVMDRYSHMNLYYLNHVKKIEKDLTLHCKIN